VLYCCATASVQAQTSKVVFEDDFSSNTINPNKFQPDAPFFEGGVGDIHAEAGNGVMKFVGTTTQQWWSGATLRVVPVFTATEETPVTVSIDRVAEAGVGSASRSALWILDETQTKYVLFADVRAEGGWRYNRKIGEEGDAPTGSGTDIAAFNGGTYDDGTLRRMSMVANGKTVKLLLDGVQGVEVKFPFSKVLFHFGSYARANNDTADTTWDNIKVETIIPKSTVVFADDFSANTIDPARYAPDAPFFEGGVGDIHAEAGNGVMRFVGTTTQQWWSGGTLRIVPTFAPSDQEIITLSIDRVAEAGVGSASRSALWVLDETQTKYVLFADVRAEGGWRYNRKIGEDGDVPTGSGTDIAAFNGGTFDNGGLHNMSMILDGKTVKLLLDGVPGAEVKFPFSPVVFHIGSYARANGDTADTTWDNLKIETAGKAAFAQSDVSARMGQLSPPVTVRIPQGLNSQADVQLRVVSANANIAVPEGGTGGALTLTYPVGGPNTATFRVRGLALGGTQFSLEGDIAGANRLSVAVISDPGVVLTENFSSATIDSTKWTISEVGFETGTGIFETAVKSGVLEIAGYTEVQYWPGASLKTKNSYVATKELNLVFEVDRVAIDQFGSAARTGVFITTADRSQFVFFGQNVGETGWQVNVNPGNPTGSGTALAAFAGVTDLGRHRLRLVADGSTVEVFLDGVSGGRFPFAVTTGIHFEIGAYSRADFDSVTATFDNVSIENTLPCTTVSPSIVTMMISESAGYSAAVTVPQLLNDAAPVTVTVTSRDPNVAVPAGAVNGVLTLNFAAGAANTQSFMVTPVGLGITTFDVATTPQNCVAGSLKVEVINAPLVLASDEFAGASLDTSKWTIDSTPLVEGGFATAESAVSVSGGTVGIVVTCEGLDWPGFTVWTTQTYAPTAVSPVTFEIDRTKMEYVLVGGTSAKQRTGIWIKDAGGNYVFFSDFGSWDGLTGGWQYHRSIGQAGDIPVATSPLGGTYIAAINAAKYTDQKNHRMKMVANGSTVKLYLDGALGAEVSFPFAQGITFGFGAYVNFGNSAQNIVRGYFDNATVLGGAAPIVVPSRLSATVQGANLVISWTGTGTLQEAAELSASINWQNVTPAPTGNSYTVPLGQAPGAKFYRLRQ
jgi:hypothetical protein